MHEPSHAKTKTPTPMHICTHTHTPTPTCTPTCTHTLSLHPTLLLQMGASATARPAYLHAGRPSSPLRPMASPRPSSPLRPMAPPRSPRHPTRYPSQPSRSMVVASGHSADDDAAESNGSRLQLSGGPSATPPDPKAGKEATAATAIHDTAADATAIHATATAATTIHATATAATASHEHQAGVEIRLRDLSTGAAYIHTSPSPRHTAEPQGMPSPEHLAAPPHAHTVELEVDAFSLDLLQLEEWTSTVMAGRAASAAAVAASAAASVAEAARNIASSLADAATAATARPHPRTPSPSTSSLPPRMLQPGLTLAGAQDTVRSAGSGVEVAGIGNSRDWQGRSGSSGRDPPAGAAMGPHPLHGVPAAAALNATRHHHRYMSSSPSLSPSPSLSLPPSLSPSPSPSPSPPSPPASNGEAAHPHLSSYTHTSYTSQGQAKGQVQVQEHAQEQAQAQVQAQAQAHVHATRWGSAHRVTEGSSSSTLAGRSSPPTHATAMPPSSSLPLGTTAVLRSSGHAASLDVDRLAGDGWGGGGGRRYPASGRALAHQPGTQAAGMHQGLQGAAVAALSGAWAEGGTGPSRGHQQPQQRVALSDPDDSIVFSTPMATLRAPSTPVVFRLRRAADPPASAVPAQAWWGGAAGEAVQPHAMPGPPPPAHTQSQQQASTAELLGTLRKINDETRRNAAQLLRQWEQVGGWGGS